MNTINCILVHCSSQANGVPLCQVSCYLDALYVEHLEFVPGQLLSQPGSQLLRLL